MDTQSLPDTRARIGVLVSGGVDSAVSLTRLVRNGFRTLTAYYLKIWLEDELSGLGECPWEEDLAFARAVCERLDVPLRVVPLQLEYYERVVQYVLDELRVGRTPSPDVFCNQRIKFGAFWDAVRSEQDYVASGHYAQLRVDSEGKARLYRAPDPVKDQTYFLSHLSADQLSRLVFPIGDLTKREVRSLAALLDLPPCGRPDSQGICFLGRIRYPDFVRYYLGERTGRIVETDTGRTLGEHRGYWFYTVGQRQGLGLGGGPWYVVGKDVAENVVFVSHASNIDSRAVRRIPVGPCSWLHEPPDDGELLEVKLRHGPRMAAARFRREAAGTDLASAEYGAGRWLVELDEPDSGVAPGQFVVGYRGDECIGAAAIR